MKALTPWRSLLLCWILATGPIWPAILRGQGQQALPVSPRSAAARVEVNLVGAVGGNREFLQLIEEWLTANDVAYVTRSVEVLQLEDITQAQGSGPPVKIWVTLDAPHSLRMYLAEPDARRYLVRDVPLPSGFDEVGRERSVQVILSSALAFMQRRVASSLREVERAFQERSSRPAPSARIARTRPPPGPGTATHRDTARPGFGVGAFYAVSDQAEWSVSHGPGGLLLAEFPLKRFALRTLLRGQYRWQPIVTTPRVRIAERSIDLCASGAVQWPRREAFYGHIELGGGLNLVDLTPDKLAESSVEPRPRRWDMRPFATALLGAGWQSGQVQAELLVRLDLEMRQTLYTVQAQSGELTEAKPSRLRPGLVLDLVWLTRSRR